MNIKMKKIEVNVTDTRIFQHLVLLFDRSDFYISLLIIRAKVKLGKIPLDLKNDIIGQYSGIPRNLSSETEKLINSYKYPTELFSAFLAALLRWKVTDEDVSGYKPVSFPRRGLIREYLHPILRIPVQKTIRRDREWFWMHQDGRSYQQITKKHYKNYTKYYEATVQSAIESYTGKLNIKL